MEPNERISYNIIRIKTYSILIRNTTTHPISYKNFYERVTCVVILRWENNKWISHAIVFLFLKEWKKNCAGYVNFWTGHIIIITLYISRVIHSCINWIYGMTKKWWSCFYKITHASIVIRHLGLLHIYFLFISSNVWKKPHVQW